MQKHSWLTLRPEVVGHDRIADEKALAKLKGKIPTFQGARVVVNTRQGLKVRERDLDIQSQLNRHLLVIGSTGSGKTSNAIFPMILSGIKRGDSLVIPEAKADISGLVLDAVDRLLESGEIQQRPKVIFISFSEPDLSTGFNPIAEIDSRRDARAIMTQLSLVETPGKEPFFRMQAVNLTTALLSGRKAGTLPQLANLINADVNELEKALNGQMPSLIEGLRSSGSNAQTVLMEAQTYLEPFCDEDVAAVTSSDEFKFDILLQGPTIVIVRMPEGENVRLKPIHGLFFDSLLSFVMEKTKLGGKLSRQITVFLDEFASALPKLDAFPRVVNTCRSRGVSFIAACQSLSQVASMYGEDAETVLAGFGSFLALPRVSPRDSEYLSSLTGTVVAQQYETVGSIIVSKSATVRPTLLAKEISDGHIHPKLGRCATLILADSPSIQLWLRPIWEYTGFEDWRSTSGAYAGKPLPNREESLSSPVMPKSERTFKRFSDPRGMTRQKIKKRIREVVDKLGFSKASTSAQKWWMEFEDSKQSNLGIILRLSEELLDRDSSIDEFFLAYVYSNSDNIQANLHYLDFQRAKKAAERNRRNDLHLKSRGGVPPEEDSAEFYDEDDDDN